MQIPQSKRNVGLVYDLDLLLDITKNSSDSLLGPVGSFYSRERNDQLNALAKILLTKFIFPIRRKMEQYFEIKSQGELVEVERVNLKEVLMRVHYILQNNMLNKRELTLLYLIASIYLANLCEEEGDYRAGIQIMRAALSRLIETREHRIKSSTEYSSNPNTSMYAHLNEFKIKETEKEKEERYKTWENLILSKERSRVRQECGLPILDDDETEEEASEVNRIEKEKHHYDKFILQFKPQEGDGQPESNPLRRGKWTEKQFYENYSQIDDLLNDLHIDILA